MFFLMMTVCASAAMTDCHFHSVVDTKTRQQCEVVADIYRDTMGDKPDKNYRLECIEYVEE